MMSQRSRFFLTLAVGLICLVPLTASALDTYYQDFETLLQMDPDALSNDGWVVYGNVYDPLGTWLYGYGVFPAPNDGFAFCQIDIGEGGVEQGLQQLVVFSDFNNGDHAIGNLIEANTFQEWTISAADVGKTFAFEYQAKMGNLELDSTALAFIKTLDPANGYATTNFVSQDMTTTPVDWIGYKLTLLIDEGLVGQLIQIGFSCTATNYEGAGIFYDNVLFEETEISAVPGGLTALGATLHQNYPNPFNPMTRIDFSLDRSETVNISVFDLGGRRVATLHQGELGAGEHHVVWNGKTDSGASAPAGQYWYLLKTGSAQVSRSMVLLK